MTTGIKLVRTLLLVTMMSVASRARAEHSLELFFIPSPHGINWETPQTLGISILKNYLSFRKRFMGHVFIRLQCRATSTWTGIVAKELKAPQKLFFEGMGLGILYHSFPGELETEEIATSTLAEMVKQNRANMVRYNINERTCARLRDYLAEFQEKKLWSYYGLTQRPLFGEGAGCGRYAASFLEVAGLLDQEHIQNWGMSINLPAKYIGNPVNNQYIFFPSMVLFGGEWGRTTEHRIFFWDPDKMFETTEQRILAGHNGARRITWTHPKIGEMPGLEYNAGHLAPPETSVWKTLPIKATKQTDRSYYLPPARAAIDFTAPNESDDEV